MNEDRFSGWLENRRAPQTQSVYRGFATNPLAGSMSEAQARMYQEAFERAQREAQRSRWRVVECMN
ncbi:MAG TPA: hypothetical protein VFE62_06300 [Gemmataceae bacterium]|nr:hypothetical protein [Gemmataceae bacterium]